MFLSLSHFCAFIERRWFDAFIWITLRKRQSSPRFAGQCIIAAACSIRYTCIDVLRLTVAFFCCSLFRRCSNTNMISFSVPIQILGDTFSGSISQWRMSKSEVHQLLFPSLLFFYSFTFFKEFSGWTFKYMIDGYSLTFFLSFSCFYL